MAANRSTWPAAPIRRLPVAAAVHRRRDAGVAAEMLSRVRQSSPRSASCSRMQPPES